jgi:hypothetical protein
MFHFQSLHLHIFVSPQQRSPSSRFPSQSSHRKRHSISRAFFYLSLKVHGEEVPPMGPPCRGMPVTWAFFDMSFKVPSKGAPPGPPLRAPIERERETPPLQSLLLPVSRSPQWRSLSSKFPQRGPYGERHLSQSLLLHISRSPNENGLLIKIETHLSKSLVKEPPSCSLTGPLWREMPFSRAFFYISLYPKSLSPPFCPRAACKPDKASDICRSIWAALIKGSAPFPEPWINSFIHISRSPHLRSSSTTHGEKNTVTVHGAPRGRKAYIQWGAAWFPKEIVHDMLLTTPVPCSLRHDTLHLGLGRPEPC